MATYTQQQRDFLATELPLAQRESKRTGIPVSVFLAQSWNETSAGTSSWFRQFSNPAGIGVTGAPGAGNRYANLSAAFTDYANKLLGIGEAGQGQFAADVKAHAGATQLLADLEAAPWAAGHYGGHGLEQLWAAQGLGSFDAPGAKAPTGGTQIHTVAYIPGTGVHIPGTGSGSSVLPGNPLSDAAGAIFSPLVDFLKQGAIRASLVVFGAVAILLGLALLVRDAAQDHEAASAGRQEGHQAAAGARQEEPAQRRMTPPAPQPAESPRVGGTSSAGPVSKDVAQTGKGAEELAAGA